MGADHAARVADAEHANAATGATDDTVPRGRASADTVRSSAGSGALAADDGTVVVGGEHPAHHVELEAGAAGADADVPIVVDRDGVFEGRDRAGQHLEVLVDFAGADRRFR
ncbi:MAG: hypothetical protein U5K81_07155 [Trueperaceae bacterium]|nr:hypothetical protein [Trueperaceae bacterium]